ncbi:MAG: GNAT family N-acetyltransferase [Proteobacteria bacterium]|nr:MAG: GNAT family N-acetyltransferase [Pseudomonadota bacterium]
MTHRTLVRAAETGDVDDMYALLAPYAKEHVILQRDKDDLYQHLQEFVIAEYDGVLVGTAALHIYGSNIAEIRSLVVNPDYQGKRIGHLLVEGCEKMAAQLHVAKVFALTYVDYFFISMGYAVVPKESLPHKIWTVCVHCKKFGDCDEIAVQKRLSDAQIEPMQVFPILDVMG